MTTYNKHVDQFKGSRSKGTNRINRSTYAVVSVDASGYSRLMGQDEDATQLNNTFCLELLSNLVKNNNGIVHQVVGDNLIALFDDARVAISVSIDFQKQINSRNNTSTQKMEYRIGVNYGVVSIKHDLHYGNHINIAARLEALAIPGGLAVSGNIVEQFGDEQFETEYLGPISLKNIREPVEVFRIRTGYEVRTNHTKINNQKSDKLLLPKILLLPFKDIVEDKDIQYLSDGISENIIDGLSRFKSFNIIPKTNAFQYRNTTLSLTELKSFLSVSYLIEGSVYTVDGNTVITIRVANTNSEEYILSKRYSLQDTSPYQTIESITIAIITSIEKKLNRDMFISTNNNKDPNGISIPSFPES